MCRSSKHYGRDAWRDPRRDPWREAAGRPYEDPDDADERGRRIFVATAQKFGAIALLCMAIWLLTGAGYFWPAWVLLFGGIRLGAQARHVYGRPRVDIDA